MYMLLLMMDYHGPILYTLLPVGIVFAAGSVKPGPAAWLWPVTVDGPAVPAAAVVAAAAVAVGKCLWSVSGPAEEQRPSPLGP